MKDATVSVVLSVYNTGDFLAEALDSVLHQTLKASEIIVVDDASTDQSAEILADYAARFPEIRLINNSANIGLAASLNKAIGLAEGDYIARMDADDIALPSRFEAQAAFLDRHQDHVLVGGQVIHIAPDGKFVGETGHVLEDRDVRQINLFQNPFSHPAVMFRRSLFSRDGLKYDVAFDTTQDWAFWKECLKAGKAANLAEHVLKQRLHDQSISIRKRGRQIENSIIIQRDYAAFLLGGEWDADVFRQIDTVFLAGREEAGKLGPVRVSACFCALAILDRIVKRFGHRETRYIRSFVIDRVIRMGVVPPFEPGWIRLLAVTIGRYPEIFARNFARLVFLRLAR
ncbi:glycosyltransferase family 2 protein [Aestuariispira insulae]|uniref:Glycosyl transferase family 2 n=1 Tax=Aestuariispira insulae TaxID=1461337 RepID=A0A3D9H468_9PROT|nr:glycosyltransferase [Aestuariispira insulae]RED44282.1 glycosyl transferase family 2 [Aestuariispira insulae]